MLDNQITIQIIISICVVLSFLGFNYNFVLPKLKPFIKTYSIVASVIYLGLAITTFDFTKNIISFANFLFEFFLILFPWFYYSILEYVVIIIDNDKSEQKKQA